MTEQDRWTVINGLRCAAAEYDRIATADLRAGDSALGQHFREQAIAVRSLADKYENGIVETINAED